MTESNSRRFDVRIDALLRDSVDGVEPLYDLSHRRTNWRNAMVYVPAANTAQVEVRGSLYGVPIENTQYFKRLDTIDPAEANGLFDWYEAVWIPAMVLLTVDDLTWDELYMTDLTTSSSPTYSRVLSPPVAGGISSAALPGNISAVTSFRTANRGRSARGRNYMAGLAESSVTDNTLLLALVNDLVAAYELFLGGGTFPAGWIWSVVSRYLDNAPRSSALVQEITDVLVTDLTVDTRRGRLA